MNWMLRRRSVVRKPVYEQRETHRRVADRRQHYQSITGAPPATARRDLVELVALGGLRRTGELRGARYWLAFETSGKGGENAVSTTK